MVSSRDPYVTVFIPTYYAEEYLEQLLDKLFKQETDFAFEVLIYDTDSKDETPKIIKKFAQLHKNLRYKTIQKSEYGHGKTRQAAAEDARGEVIVYLSHDAIPAHERWLYEITKPFSLNDKIVAVLGKQTPRPRACPLLKNEIKAVFANMGPDEGTTLFYEDDFLDRQGQRDIVTFYSDVNSATRTQFLKESIPYRDVRYAEDQFFGRDVVAAGYIKAYAPRGCAVHSNDIRLRDYKARIFDETLGLRQVGIAVGRPSKKIVAKMLVKGVVKDWMRTVSDPDYSWKRKLYWLVINPFYHIEKWRGILLATRQELDITENSAHRHSLEARQRRERQ